MAKKLSELAVGTLVKDTGTTYNGTPIVFTVMEHNHEGDPEHSTALIASNIITIKCFDAMERNNSSSDRTYGGNNRYIHSNIKQWLNSDKEAGAWYTAQHSADAPPNTDNVKSGLNAYDQESGFLKNFSEKMKKELMTVTKRTMKPNIDGGGYEEVTQKIFLLSVTEIGAENKNGVAEGSIYELFHDKNNWDAYPTAEAMERVVQESEVFKLNETGTWLLRTPEVSDGNNVKAGSHGRLSGATCRIQCGIRPACVVSSSIVVSDTPDTDGAYTIRWNVNPVIEIESENLGNKWSPFQTTYQVKNLEVQTITITEYIDDKEVRIIQNAPQNEPITFDLSSFDMLENEKMHKLTIQAVNAEGIETSRTIEFTKLYPELKVELKPVETDAPAEKIWITLEYEKTGNPNLKVEVTNCAYNAQVIWEDATEAFRNKKTYHFSNKVFDKQKYGVAVRATIEKNSHTERVYLFGIGYSFE